MSNEKLAGLTRYSGITIANSYVLESEEFFLARKVEALLATTSTAASASPVPRVGGNTSDKIAGSSPADAGGLTPERINWIARNCYGSGATEQEIEFAQAIEREFLAKVGASPAPSAKQEPQGWAKGYLSGVLLSDSNGYKVKLHFNTREDAEAAFEAFIAMSESAAPSASASPAAPTEAEIRAAVALTVERDGFDVEDAKQASLIEAVAICTIQRMGLVAASPAAAAAAPTEPQGQSPADFKNFHRSLCARFGYTHDEQFWWRDLVSLEEHIVARVDVPVAGSQQVPEKLRPFGYMSAYQIAAARHMKTDGSGYFNATVRHAPSGVYVIPVYDALAAAPAVPVPVAEQEAAAWMTEDSERVVTEATMAGARTDGGAILSSLRPYSVKLVRAAPSLQHGKE